MRWPEVIERPMWKLVIEDDEGKRTVVHLSRDCYTVGRKDGNSIRLTERNVSREHAKLTRSQATGNFLLDDISSYNGVYINGVRVADTQEMVNGDLVQIGDYRIIIQDERVAEAAPDLSAEVDIEDLKSTVAPGKIRRGTLLLERPNRLVMLVGPNPGYEFSLTSDRSTIGRGEDQTISVNHNSVSRAHCEIHQLAEGRYEIVDLNSANGVRVNGAQLTRGIIEAGDLIELGDVKFKFIAAGQVFIANASDSQQLTAISDREAAALATPPRKASILPYIVLGIALGGAAIGGVYALLQGRGGDQPTTGTGTASTTGTAVPVAATASNEATAVTAPAGSERDVEILNHARRLSLTNIDQAHRDIGAISEGSPLRKSPDFALIEAGWADAVIEKAQHEPEPGTRKALLESVIATPSVDDARRDQAKNLLASSPALPGASATASARPAGTAPESGPDAPGSSGTLPGSASNGTGTLHVVNGAPLAGTSSGGKPDPATTPKPTASAPLAPPSVTRPSRLSDADRARAAQTIGRLQLGSRDSFAQGAARHCKRRRTEPVAGSLQGDPRHPMHCAV